jgi:hypothetical protein
MRATACVAFVLALSAALLARQAPARQPAFDVVSIKPSNGSSNRLPRISA